MGQYKQSILADPKSVTQQGHIHVDIAELQSADGKLYFLVVNDRISNFAFAKLHQKAENMHDAFCGARCVMCVASQIGSFPRLLSAAVWLDQLVMRQRVQDDIVIQTV
jgi:hypothetical protein